jgi:hypothetical protein
LDLFSILKYKIIEASTNINPFASQTGRLLEANPYINHISVPGVNKIYMDKEMEEVSFVRMVFIAWGKKDVDVKTAAHKPITDIQFI